MNIKIYNGLLSDSNNFFIIDTDKVSFKAGLYRLAKWIENYLVNYRQQEDDFNFENPSDEYMEEESNSSMWIINGHTIYATFDDIISALYKDENVTSESEQLDFSGDSWGAGYQHIIKKA